MCNEPGVFTSKEAAERCVENMNYRYVFSLSYAAMGVFFAILFMIVSGIVGGIGKDVSPWAWLIPYMGLGIIAYAGKWGYDRSLTVPLEEQEKDEQAIQEYVSSGMDRRKSIETVQKIRGAQCESEQASKRRNRYGSRNTIGVGGINFSLG
jgi:hypothetical protein